MRKHRLDILAALSAAVLLLCLAACFVDGFVSNYRPNAASGKWSTLRLAVDVDRGGCRLHRDWLTRPATSVSLMPTSPFFRSRWKLTVPQPEPLLWGFLAMTSNGPAGHYALLAFPLWCLALPAAVAPALWVRRYRKREARGFAVEPAGSDGVS